MRMAFRLAIAAFGWAIFNHSTATVRAEDYAYTTNNGTITLTKYTGPGGTVSIPSAISGVPVTEIGPWAFDYCTSLNIVTIPNSVTNIGAWVFYLCASLTGGLFSRGCSHAPVVARRTWNPPPARDESSESSLVAGRAEF